MGCPGPRVAIERAEHAGTLFVAAAGNEGLNNDELPSYPANYPMATQTHWTNGTSHSGTSIFFVAVPKPLRTNRPCKLAHGDSIE